MTEPLRPPKESAEPGSLGSFVASNAMWGALLGTGISVAWMVIIQDFWFAIQIAVGGAVFSAIYGALSSVPAFLLGRGAAHLRSLVVGVVFAGTAMAIQIGLIMLVSAGYGWPWNWLWNAAAYALLGGVAAGLTYRVTLHDQMRTESATAAS